MLCVRAPVLEKHLVRLCQATGKTKSHYMRLALETLFSELHLHEKHYSFESSLLPDFNLARRVQECSSASLK
jgi:predicted DNA-binding protein